MKQVLIVLLLSGCMLAQAPSQRPKQQTFKDVLVELHLADFKVKMLSVAFDDKELAVGRLRAQRQSMLKNRMEEAGKATPDPSILALVNEDALKTLNLQIDTARNHFHQLLLDTLSDSEKYRLLERFGL